MAMDAVKLVACGWPSRFPIRVLRRCIIRKKVRKAC